MSQEALSTKLHINKAATARAIKSLESKGYIVRETDALDRRAKIVSSTDKAELIKERLLESRRKWAEFLQSDLDEATTAIIYEALERMANRAAKLENTKKEV
jgi:DNA-binding MarR family transcriptional regulator